MTCFLVGASVVASPMLNIVVKTKMQPTLVQDWAIKKNVLKKAGFPLGVKCQARDFFLVEMKWKTIQCKQQNACLFYHLSGTLMDPEPESAITIYVQIQCECEFEIDTLSTFGGKSRWKLEVNNLVHYDFLSKSRTIENEFFSLGKTLVLLQYIATMAAKLPQRELFIWKPEHDCCFVRELLLIEPYMHKQQSKERGQAWKLIVENLNKMEQPKLISCSCQSSSQQVCKTNGNF